MIAGIHSGKPKAIELYCTSAIANLSIYGLGVANGGAGSEGQEFTFPPDQVEAGTFLYVTFDADVFERYFGFAPNYTDSSIDLNGSDAIELFRGGSVVSVYGDVNNNGAGQTWAFNDGWAYCRSGLTASATFNVQDWIYSPRKTINKSMTLFI